MSIFDDLLKMPIMKEYPQAGLVCESEMFGRYSIYQVQPNTNASRIGILFVRDDELDMFMYLKVLPEGDNCLACWEHRLK